MEPYNRYGSGGVSSSGSGSVYPRPYSGSFNQETATNAASPPFYPPVHGQIPPPFPSQSLYYAPQSVHQTPTAPPFESYHHNTPPPHAWPVSSFSYPPNRNEGQVMFHQHGSFQYQQSSFSYMEYSNSSKPSYPLDDVLSSMHISDVPRPSESLPHEEPPSSPYALPLRYSDGPFSSPNSPGSVSSSSFQVGQHSPTSYDSVGGKTSLPLPSSPLSSEANQIVPHKSSPTALKVVLLHGTLDIWIYEAKNLPNMDLFSERLRQLFGRTASGKLRHKLEEQASHHNIITSDPYVTVNLSDAVVARTRVISNCTDPVWNQHFTVHVAHNISQVVFLVKDSDVVGAELIGNVSIPAERIRSCQRIEDSYPILGNPGKVCKTGATLKVSIQFFPSANQTLSRFGFGLGPDYIGVPNTYFPLRKAGKVTLYQDAHVPDYLLPTIRLDNNLVYSQGKCWRDICDAILQAQKLIYIVGWSVYHKLTLVRDSKSSNGVHLDTLGDLLKFKSQEGLRVLLLVWDDPTSRDILGFSKEGVMATHDEETRKFFKHSSVQVLLCPRFPGKKRSWLKQQEVSYIFTHHQKTVIVDSQAAGTKRKITAFLGGLDLCDGRYDTPEHNLFRTLGSVHKDDYHNPNFQAGIECGGPREPWHDLHCKIDGPAAYDVLKNFEQRWIKASKRHGLKKLSNRLSEDSLLALERISSIMSQSEVEQPYEHDYEKWHVQIFRSIDSGSVKGFPKDVMTVEQKNLAYIKNLVVDTSIHTAYVEAIRTAENFIYIENQYFIGSSYNWSQHKEIGANNMLPMELALKVAEKIRAHERFAVYIVVPMWPEGAPTSMSVQRILYWQGQTIQMMYETIYKALEETGLSETYSPRDYLNFFCLGNREIKDSTEVECIKEPIENTHAQAKKARRFMIYVHSKGMIVDDEYVLIGSANINQRSLDGSRDTEIAMGAYQPQYTRANKRHPHGQVYGYRMSLWAEHLGMLEQCFEHPESLECVRRIRALSESNWKQYADDQVTEMRGHLLQYPILVEAKGKVKPLPGHATFPDMGGNILGSLGSVPSYVKENLTI